MAAVRTFTLPHYDTYPVQVALFKDVKNAEFLRSQLLAANPDFDYAFLDAAMVSLHSWNPHPIPHLFDLDVRVLQTPISSHAHSVVPVYLCKVSNLLNPCTSPHLRAVFILSSQGCQT